jgi:glycosyltransferase involved in cell wall biosynthesis
VRQKRVDVLLEAFARLSERASDLRLAIAGDGPLRGALTDQVERLGLEERVAFLGVRADVVALHRAAELLVLPSEGEGLPNVVLEALAAGTPVVATDVLGTREVVRHEREALLVAPGDAQALEAALWRVLTDASLAARLATRGRARVAEAYDLERVADRAAALFAEVAGSSPRQSASGKRRRRN